MHDDGRGDEGIENGSGCGCYEGGCDEGDEGNGERPFECPVVRAMGLVWRLGWDGVVNGTIDCLCGGIVSMGEKRREEKRGCGYGVLQGGFWLAQRHGRTGAVLGKVRQ